MHSAVRGRATRTPAQLATFENPNGKLFQLALRQGSETVLQDA